MRFTIDFTLIAEWIDTRLTWNDLKEDHYLNMPSEEEKQKFWIPKFMFGNSEKNFQMPIDSEAKVLVKTRQRGKISVHYSLKETLYYSGAQNPMQLSRDFTEKFKCNFNLRYFPFDTQTCHIYLNCNNKVKNFLQLTPIHMEYVGPRDLQKILVISWNVAIDKTDSPVHIIASIVLKRKVTQLLVGVYFPSLCIMVITQVNIS